MTSNLADCKTPKRRHIVWEQLEWQLTVSAVHNGMKSKKKIQSNMEAALFASMDKINGFGNLFHTELGKFYEKPIMWMSNIEKAYN